MQYKIGNYFIDDWLYGTFFKRSINIYAEASDKYSPRYSFNRYSILLPLQDFDANSIEECKKLVDSQLTKLHKLKTFL